MEEASRTVSRMIKVLNQLSLTPHPLSNQELAQTLGVPVASMHRLLRKLAQLGYLDCAPESASYAISSALSELGRRLADNGGYLPPLRALMMTLRAQTGSVVSLWLPAGLQVRLGVLLSGRSTNGITSLPGEMREPFSTPGLAIAATYSREQRKDLTQAARRRRIPLGRRYRTQRDIAEAVQQVAQRGYAVGFNLRSDGWGMMAWPIAVSAAPARPGAIAVGLHVPELRRREPEIAACAHRLLQQYRRDLRAYASADDDTVQARVRVIARPAMGIKR